jgi:ATP-dependent Clp protease ATP-binding subunit ClpA
MLIKFFGFISLIVLASAFIIKNLLSQSHFINKSSCRTLWNVIREEIIGQDFALDLMVSCICDYLDDTSLKKPLVISTHGPVGVGKTLTHRSLARFLYEVPREDWSACPGYKCPAYKLFSSLSHVPSEQEIQSHLLRRVVLNHAVEYSNSLIVIEEFDKFDSSLRGVFRQIIDGGNIAKISLEGSIIILESNLGWKQITEISESIRALSRKPQQCAGEATSSQTKITFELVQRILKDQVFINWKAKECPDDTEDCSDLIKTLSLIDLFVPFLPLRREDLKYILNKTLNQKIAKMLTKRRVVELDTGVVDFLLEKIAFDKFGNAVDGGMEVNRVISQHVTSALFWNLVNSSNALVKIVVNGDRLMIYRS